MLKIHHLNAATMCPIGGPLVTTGFSLEAEFVSHCLVIETNDGLVLVDTGLGTEDCLKPESRFSLIFRLLLQPKFDIEETLLYQVKKLGFSVSDVRHIIPTHLDLDHAGGLPDFPHAKVHLFKPEVNAALNPAGFFEKHRYIPQHFRHKPDFQLYENTGERFKGFECIRSLEGISDEILLIPLVGPTRVHRAVAIESEQGTLIHCGDAYFHHSEVSVKNECPPGIDFFQTLVAADNESRIKNQKRLKALNHNSSDVTLFCAHDKSELLKLQ